MALDVIKMNHFDYRDMFGKIAQARNIVVTAFTPDQVARFSSENLSEFLTWAMLRLSEVHHSESGCRSTIMIRRITNERHPGTGVGIKHVGGCLIDQEGLHGINAEEARSTY